MIKHKCNTCYKLVDNNDTRHYCNYCRQCVKYCICRKRAGYMQVPYSKAAGLGSSSMFVGSKRAIGIELEIANWGSWYRLRNKERGAIMYNGKRYTYTMEHDGSVTGGQEAVFDPLVGDQNVINGLNAIANHVYINECTVDASCGYHVHVNAQDFGWYEIQKLSLFWMLSEIKPSLYLLAGRQPNRYCRTWQSWIVNLLGVKVYNPIKSFPYELNKFKETYLSWMYGFSKRINEDEINRIKNSNLWHSIVKASKQLKEENPRARIPKPNLAREVEYLNNYLNNTRNRGWNHAVECRYLNLNTHSWKYRGTIEYRLGAGTTNIDDIRMWPIWCLWFTEAVSRTSLDIIYKFYGKEDPIEKLVADGGILIPSINGNVLYPMPKYLQDWASNKIIKKA